MMEEVQRDESPRERGLQHFVNMFQENKYVVLTVLAACMAMLSTKRKLVISNSTTGEDHHSVNMTTTTMNTTNSTEPNTFMDELFNSNISAIIMMHFFIVIMYYVFVGIAQIGFGTIRSTEIQYTKESVIHFILMRCLLLASTLGPIHDKTKVIYLFIWLTCLALLRAFLALSKARFEYLLTTPLTRLTLFQRLGLILGSVLVCNFILAWWSQKIPVLSRTVIHLGWFEASLLTLKCLQLGAKLTFHTLENGRSDDDDEGELTDDKESVEDNEKNRTEWHETCLLWSQVILAGVYVLVLGCYYLFIVSMDHFRVSFLDFILLINVKNASLDLLQKMQQLQLYRQVIVQMDTLFPNANEQELLQVKEDVCVICLKPLDQAKKLTCGHLFHRICLRQCLQKATATTSTTTAATQPPNTSIQNRQPSFFDTAAIAFNRRSARASAAASSLKCPICRQRVFDEPTTEREQQEVEPLVVTDATVGALQVPEEQDQGIEMTADVIRISTANLPRWLPIPNISLEIVRQVPDDQPIEELVARVLEVFPQWPIEVIQRDLRRTQSAQRTIENILSGRLSTDPEANELDALREDHGHFFSFFTDLWNLARRRQPEVANPTNTTANTSQPSTGAPSAAGAPAPDQPGSSRLNPQIAELNVQEELEELFGHEATREIDGHPHQH